MSVFVHSRIYTDQETILTLFIDNCVRKTKYVDICCIQMSVPTFAITEIEVFFLKMRYAFDPMKPV